MFNRFNNILNGLKALGKTYSNSELVRKILRAFPKSWASKKDRVNTTCGHKSLSNAYIWSQKKFLLHHGHFWVFMLHGGHKIQIA